MATVTGITPIDKQAPFIPGAAPGATPVHTEGSEETNTPAGGTNNNERAAPQDRSLGKAIADAIAAIWQAFSSCMTAGDEERSEPANATFLAGTVVMLLVCAGFSYVGQPILMKLADVAYKIFGEYRGTQPPA